MPRLVAKGEVELNEEVMPFDLVRDELLMCGEAARCHVIDEDGEVRAKEVVVSHLETVDHGGHLLLMYRVPLLSITKLMTFKHHQMI